MTGLQRLLEDGKTLGEVGILWGVSRQRVHQRVKSYGIDYEAILRRRREDRLRSKLDFYVAAKLLAKPQHEEQFLVNTLWRVVKNREHASAWAKAHPALANEQRRKWRKDNPEKNKASHRNWYKALTVEQRIAMATRRRGRPRTRTGKTRTGQTAEQWRQKREARPKYQQAVALWLGGKSYDEIGSIMGFSRQCGQQYIRPDSETIELLKARAGDACEHCGIPEPFTGHHHAHHKALVAPHNDLSNLEYLCKSCHKIADGKTTMGCMQAGIISQDMVACIQTAIAV